ncbi:aminodeoxychorismate lyase, partial [Azotobacter chroococcum]|nr:aminodeoxychorismate lyase [Azotobacter chroococcum]
MRKWLLLLESGLLVGGLVLAFAVWQQKAALEQPLILTEERLLEVPSGATPGGLLNRLQGDGLLRGSF